MYILQNVIHLLSNSVLFIIRIFKGGNCQVWIRVPLNNPQHSASAKVNMHNPNNAIKSTNGINNDEKGKFFVDPGFFSQFFLGIQFI